MKWFMRTCQTWRLSLVECTFCNVATSSFFKCSFCSCMSSASLVKLFFTSFKFNTWSLKELMRLIRLRFSRRLMASLFLAILTADCFDLFMSAGVSFFVSSLREFVSIGTFPSPSLSSELSLSECMSVCVKLLIYALWIVFDELSRFTSWTDSWMQSGHINVLNYLHFKILCIPVPQTSQHI